MAKVQQPGTLTSADEVESMIAQIRAILVPLSGNIEFGNPTNPSDITDTTLAGSSASAHPGTQSNIFGSFFEVELEADATVVVCHHNLYTVEALQGYYTTASTGPANVLWLVMKVEHDGENLANEVGLSVWRDTTDPLAPNFLSLQFHVVKTVDSGVLLVDSSHKMKVTLFFMRAENV